MADTAAAEGRGEGGSGLSIGSEHHRGRGRGRGRGRSRGRGGKGRGGLDTSEVSKVEESIRNLQLDPDSTAGNAGPSQDSRRGRGTARRGGRGGKRGGPSTQDAIQTKDNHGNVNDESNGNTRRRKFIGMLTETGVELEGENTQEIINKQNIVKAKVVPIEYNDLRSRLIAELSSGAYDCIICYSCVTTKSPIWSCSQCHSVLHLSCTQKWADASVAKIEEQNSRQEDPLIRNRKGTWRCPGCQLAREQVPRQYHCWDGQVIDPIGGKGSPPHSCGKPCAKGKCIHGCAAGLCHPGPCPPCPISITRGCFCGSKQITLRCSQLRTTSSSQLSSSVSCGERCGKMLDCGSHSCSRICHDDPCGGCEEVVDTSCYCGEQTKAIKCGQGLPKMSYKVGAKSDVEKWQGRWSCESTCSRPFACHKHTCQKQCHALDHEDIICPFSPGLMTSCPCGAEEINTNRTSCEDEIRTCGKTCHSQLKCGHSCESPCHPGSCPPCRVSVSTPCRCGETKKQLSCHQREKEEQEGGQEVLCQTICRSLRLCGKHECRRRCCPLYFQAKSKSKRKPTYEELIEQDPAGLHACDVDCGKLLRCGTHHCEMNCHRGPCPPCLQASFHELSCHCGRTVMDPPIPCGTVIQCYFPCTRPPPSCGHPKQQHDCHEMEPCPPCIYLVDKVCICGKNTVANVPCHRSRVSCGHTCDAVLNCGFHRCQKSCHDIGQCGPCHQTCTKPRKCGHSCPEPCHAPASCPETLPCQAWVTLLCACGHQQQQVRCGHSIHSPQSSNDRTLKCNDACLLAQRNAKLAEALGLNPSDKSQPSDYPSTTMQFFGSNRRFADEVETTLVEFIKSHKHAIIFSPPTPTQRAFIHELVAVFGLQSEDVDEEPKRSVAVRRGMHGKIPNPLLKEAYQQYQSSSSTRLRPMAVGQLKKEDPRPSSIINLNALLLKGVFGVEESSLNAILRQITAGSPVHLRWINEEDVVAIVSNSNTIKLRTWSQEIRNMGLLNAGSSRIARDVVACYCNENGQVVQIDLPSSSASIGMSKIPSTPGTNRTTGAWAAVAANTANTNPRPSPWSSSPLPFRPASTTAHVSSITRSNRPSTQAPAAPIPDQWDS